MFKWIGKVLLTLLGLSLIAAGALWYLALWRPVVRALAEWAGEPSLQAQTQPPLPAQSQQSTAPAPQSRRRGRAGGTAKPSTQAAPQGGSAVQNCPPPITGRFTSAADGRRIQLDVRIQGPAGEKQVSAILDSGAVQTSLPDSLLRSLGYKPISGPHAVGGVGSGSSVAYTYRVRFPEVADKGAWAPLGSGTLLVQGIRGFDMVLIGPDVLERGVSLQTQATQWQLTLPCMQP